MFTEVIKLLNVEETRTDTGGISQNVVGEREVFAELRGIGQREFYEAAASGLKPEAAFRLADILDYNNERFIAWNGKRYAVLRTYSPAEGNYIDIVVNNIVNRGGEEHGAS